MVKHCEPGCFEARAKAAAFIKATRGGTENGLEGDGGVGGAGEAGGLRFCEGSKADLAGSVDRIELSRSCERKVILPNTQSINGLWRVSQLYPRTTEQEGSRGVTNKSMVIDSPEPKVTGMEQV